MRYAARMLLCALLAAGCEPERDRARGQTAPVATPAPPATPAPEFDGDAAFALLQAQVAFGPRIPGSRPHELRLQWMTEYLRARADTVLLQPFTHEAQDGTVLRLNNVFARFRPELQRRILLLAHWDTRPNADQEASESDRTRPVPGANDGASGVAVLLHLAELLAHDAPPIGVDLLLTDGEDYGPGDMYLGATHFAANVGPYRPLYGVLIDMVGDQNPHFPIEAYSQELAPAVVQRVWGLAQQLGLGMLFPATVGIPVSDDHLPLNRAGIPTINIIDFDYGPANAYWHTLSDDVANTSPRGLAAVGLLLTELIYRGG